MHACVSHMQNTHTYHSGSVSFSLQIHLHKHTHGASFSPCRKDVYSYMYARYIHVQCSRESLVHTVMYIMIINSCMVLCYIFDLGALVLVITHTVLPSQ